MIDIIQHIAQTQFKIDTSSLPNGQATSATIKRILDIVFTITGAVALLIVTLAGFQYTLSRGDSQKVSQAKDTILYALVGLIISIAAFSIVNLVVKAT